LKQGVSMGKPRAELQYLSIARQILEEGEPTDDRTGVGTLDLFGEPQMAYDLREEFPLLTSKNVATKAVRSELAWMLHGDTNLRYLAEHDNHIWDEWPFVAYLKQTNQAIPEQGSEEWKSTKDDYLQKIKDDTDFAEEYGNLGPIYGHQWRAWADYNGNPIDQLRIAQDQIRNGKASRRIIVSAWNVSDLDEMSKAGLPPCHTLFQFNASNQTDPKTGKKYLDMKMYQRSADWFLGVPFNMVQYAMLLSAMAQTTGRTPRYFYHTFGSAHIYKNHTEQIKEQLSREDKLYEAPRLKLNPAITDIGDFEAEDFKIVGYKHHPSIKGQVAI
jgi:thymidylate synthase